MCGLQRQRPRESRGDVGERGGEGKSFKGTPDVQGSKMLLRRPLPRTVEMSDIFELIG